MKRIALVLGAVSSVIAIQPAVSSAASSPTGRHFGVYRYVYRHALHRFGPHAVGCELVYTCKVQPVSDDIVVSSTHTLESMLYPRPKFHWVAHVPAPTVSLPYGNWAIPSAIVGCESTYQNLPPNSADASGYYQILGSTWKLYGGPPPYEAYEHSKSEQDVIAAKIWDGGNGASQWVCKAKA